MWSIAYGGIHRSNINKLRELFRSRLNLLNSLYGKLHHPVRSGFSTGIILGLLREALWLQIKNLTIFMRLQEWRIFTDCY
jgi:hypothetical protein